MGRPRESSGTSLVVDPRLAEANERPQAPDEPHPLGQGVQGVNNLPVHQAEIAAVEGNVQVADRVPVDPIKGEIAQPVSRDVRLPGAPSATDRVDDVVPLPPAANEMREDLGRVLQVAVHHDHAPAPSVVEPRRDGGLVPEVAAQADHEQARVHSRKPIEQPRGRVDAAVVHEDQLIDQAQGRERGHQPPMEGLDVRLLVEEGHDHAQVGASSMGVVVHGGPGPSSRVRNQRGLGYSIFENPGQTATPSRAGHPRFWTLFS